MSRSSQQEQEEQKSRQKPATKDWMSELKKNMQSVRDASKKSEKYLSKLEQANFIGSGPEIESVRDYFKKNLQLCEECIS